jgi:Ca2+-binding RTX toxin-like protein
MGMRRTVLLLVSKALVVLCASGIALALGGFTPETYCTADPCLGTDGVDLLGGTAEAETIDVLAGNDLVTALRGKDVVYGREGNDELDGHYGNDTIYGGPGTDLLYGAAHSDTVYGGKGADRIRAEGYDSEGIRAHLPVDRSYGQGANDRIVAFDGYKDIIDCGPGSEDTVVYDRNLDTIKNCEIKRSY